METRKKISNRVLSVAGFAFLFSYLMAFLFEGQVLYGLLEARQVEASGYIMAAIAAQFAGLFSAGFFVKSPKAAKYALFAGMGVSLLVTLPFFFPPTVLWFSGLIVGGFASGCALASWGYYLKTFTPKNERIKSCADAMIFSNLLMIVIDLVAGNVSPAAKLLCIVVCIPVGIIFMAMLPVSEKRKWGDEPENRLPGDIKTPLGVLFLFVAIITIDSGLMYQVINPAFAHLTGLVTWYWAVPYIVAMVIVRNLPAKAKRSRLLYVGMAMIIGAFICFMLLGRGEGDYLAVDTLMLGACGIFDLFWWSVIGEMLDYTDNPVCVFGIGLSANVFGVLCGGLIGLGVTSMELPGAEVTVIALVVVCITLSLLPPLNRQLAMLLKSHAYLAVYDRMSPQQQTTVLRHVKTLDPLTGREEEVLVLILSGKSNREIAQALFISESTVKTHVGNIFSKYDVGSRAELISTLLKNQSGS
ncbi:MAG TPA: LuxR C-terminal-related transcriptional regulator [Oscillospiraceae bacterium]|nr:LuxR C-terminal-related transcriptional regulator [Oscillospiraceae bacterium]